MAAFTLSPATPSQLCSTNYGVSTPTKLGQMSMSVGTESAGRERGINVTCHAASFPADGVPDMERRKLMNLLLFGAVGLPAAATSVPDADFFRQLRSGGTVAKDEFGNQITSSEWLKTHEPCDRTLTQGLKGDPTYLIVGNNKTLATYGINGVCTHLGCIVPWNTVENKFMCPCHGSEYDDAGKVLSGPALTSLELARVDIDDGKVMFSPWLETDFRRN